MTSARRATCYDHALSRADLIPDQSLWICGSERGFLGVVAFLLPVVITPMLHIHSSVTGAKYI